MPSQLRYPDDARRQLFRAWARNRSLWLAGGGKWPFAITLGLPTQVVVRQQLDAVASWIQAWHSHDQPGSVEWQERHWSELGRHKLPVRLILDSPDEIAKWVGEEHRWRVAHGRFQEMVAHWPTLTDTLSRHFDILADYSGEDFERLVNMLSWLEKHPQSNLFPRQLPVPGIDSKWLEARYGLITEFMGAIGRVDTAGRDFFDICGLRPLPILVRLNILDPALRAAVGGLRDLAGTPDDLTRLDLPTRCVFVVENIQTGLAFGDLEGAAVLMGLGYGVDVIRQFPFIKQARTIYWGDIDTHGFAILSRARGYFSSLQSILMDESTLLRYRDLKMCGEEPKQNAAESLPHLTCNELAAYRVLKEQKLGMNLRLEQERIPWSEAWDVVQAIHQRAMESSK